MQFVIRFDLDFRSSGLSHYFLSTFYSFSTRYTMSHVQYRWSHAQIITLERKKLECS